MFVRLNIGLVPSAAVKSLRRTQADRLAWAAHYAAPRLSGVVRLEHRDGPHEPFLAVDGTYDQPLPVLRSWLHHLAVLLDQDCIAAQVSYPETFPENGRKPPEQFLIGPRCGPWEPFREDLFYRIP